MVRKKFDLKENLLPGISFRSVRDAIRAAGVHLLSADELCIHLFAPDIRKAIQNNARATENVSYWLQLRFIRQLWAASSDQNSPEYEFHWGNILDLCRELKLRIPDVTQALVDLDIITPASQAEGVHELGDAGRTLAAQKALKRISRDRGQVLLEKVVHAAVAYNQQGNLTYRIDKIYLFGSLLTGKSDIGDVDLVVIAARAYQPEESQEDFIHRDQMLAQKLGLPSFFGLRTCSTEPRKYLQKISPYLSIAGECTLITLKNNDEEIKMVYDATTGIFL
ncbi:hypothetical protein [Insolitispirillum peregrinum]|uniref:hypothetical protein n=1 Tax=Insolitispirillum peregrinum TaxID=80876 RepID=UPI00361B4BCF